MTVIKKEQSKPKVNYEKEFYNILEFMNNIGLQMQVAVQNTKARIQKETTD